MRLRYRYRINNLARKNKNKNTDLINSGLYVYIKILREMNFLMKN